MPIIEKKVVVTGGAGYIGSCACALLSHRGYLPIVLDNFSTGHLSNVRDFPYFKVELTDFESTNSVWEKIGKAHAVIHFAAKTLVDESCRHPEIYFRNNLLATLNTAECALLYGTQLFIHSSSCSVYGSPNEMPISEDASLIPSSPYGESKYCSERILDNLRTFHGLKAINLRYFNPAGSIENGAYGENHDPETHLIPNIINAALSGQEVSVFGKDYNTLDGTCSRDFIHIEDLIEAHLIVLNNLEQRPDEVLPAINLGSGKGTSILEVIQTAERVLEKKIKIKFCNRRKGDPPLLIADTSLAKKILSWEPKKSLADMILSHYLWKLHKQEK